MAIRETDREAEDPEQEDPFAAAEREAYEAAAALGESRSSSAALTGCLVVVVIVLPAVLYFGLFAVILIEEIVVGSGWFRENLPQSVLGFLSVIYSPLIWLMDQFDG